MKLMVSVIMPAYNAENTIKEAIQSILNQTYSNFELIICDDGSQDKTLEIIRSFKDSRIKILLNENNIGNLLTTNKLLDSCTGDFIALQDADDYSSEDRLQKQINIIKEKNIDLVSSNVGLVFKSKVINVIQNPVYPNNFMNKIQVPVVWGACLFKKEIFSEIGGFDVVFDRIGSADYNWLQRASLKFTFYNIQETLYFYRQHSNSVTKLNKKIVIEKLYSEEIAFDIYMEFSKNGYYDFELSKKIFEVRKDYYINKFSKDKSKLLGVFYNDLQFSNLNYFKYLKKIYQIKSKKNIKLKYILQGFLLKTLGMKNLEKIKGLLR
ncbi:glycosyltransferase family 2 protein [Acinetobacter indicus]|uniref:glycosyltransferase family 2 protein n=1 Tax=Acinetobacter indicus TaxID=756892 RepID=UPI00144392E4|nr:glycosyltransferase [Acinetobacter indicus]